MLGVRQIEVSMFEFTPAQGEVTIRDGAIARDWVLNMPKLSERGGPAVSTGTAAAAAPLPAAPGIGRGARGNRGADGQGGRGPGRGAAGQVQGGFQSAAVRATPEGQRENAQQQDAAQNIDL